MIDEQNERPGLKATWWTGTVAEKVVVKIRTSGPVTDYVSLGGMITDFISVGLTTAFSVTWHLQAQHGPTG